MTLQKNEYAQLSQTFIKNKTGYICSGDQENITIKSEFKISDKLISLLGKCYTTISFLHLYRTRFC